MQTIRSRAYNAEAAWGCLPVAHLDASAVKPHWTDPPDRWHVDEGQEVFAVMGGMVAMHGMVNGPERVSLLEAGDVLYADVGTEHVAHPQGAASVLVIEKEGSV